MIKILTIFIFAITLNVYAETSPLSENDLECGKYGLQANSMNVELSMIKMEKAVVYKNAELLKLQSDKLIYIGKLAEQMQNFNLLKTITVDLKNNTDLFNANTKKYYELTDIEEKLSTNIEEIEARHSKNNCPVIELSHTNIGLICKAHETELSENLNCIAFNTAKELKKGESF